MTGKEVVIMGKIKCRFDDGNFVIKYRHKCCQLKTFLRNFTCDFKKHSRYERIYYTAFQCLNLTIDKLKEVEPYGLIRFSTTISDLSGVFAYVTLLWENSCISVIIEYRGKVSIEEYCKYLYTGIL